MLLMAILFLAETTAFASSRLSTSIALDDSTETLIRVNFNITLLDLHCDYVSVDVWDSLGTNQQNVTKNIDKWQLDEDGVRRVFSGRNRDLRAVEYEDHSLSLEEMHADGIFVSTLTKENFTEYLQQHEMAFIDMYAPWCVWCQRLAPTWEMFARYVHENKMPIGVAKVDCVADADLCREERIMAFPTLKWYHAGQQVTPDYKMDRTVNALASFAKRKLEMDEKFKNWQQDAEADAAEVDKKRQLYQQHRPEHPGCQVSGQLLVNRVPGNFHLEAKSKNHNLNAALTNLSHVVNHLSFGEWVDDHDRKSKRILKQVPEEHKQFSPMDGHSYVTSDFHQAFHHYIKVVSTNFKLGASAYNSMETYQMLEQSQIVYYETANVPEARFSYDLSPMSVVVEKEGRKWYDYVTSICAILGGTFTTLGLIDAMLYRILKPKKL